MSIFISLYCYIAMFSRLIEDAIEDTMGRGRSRSNNSDGMPDNGSRTDRQEELEEIQQQMQRLERYY
jgi:hypothetical protein